MAKTKIGEREIDFGALWDKNRKAILGTVGALAVVAGGLWFWTASRTLKEERAEIAFSTAEQTFYSGNFQLAATELERVVARYSGTKAGVRATMLLARTRYGEKRHTDGVELLREVVGSGAARPYRAPIHALIASGLENQQQFSEAAEAYRQAAASAATEFDTYLYEADQARALASGGQKEEALVIWRRHAARESAPTASEARLRIGELSATTAGS
jgi:predicted negative regulator of RcsB-dependent stress response